MASRTLTLDDSLYDYLLTHSLREPAILARLRQETEALEDAVMQISPEQGQFMALMVELMSAMRILEVGTFTGYSSLAMALAQPPGGRITCCDISEDYTAIARRYWAEAGVEDRIALHLGPAVETLTELIEKGDEIGTYDIVFIDADKENYGQYVEQTLSLLRPGGLLMVDNVLWSGKVADPQKDDADTQAIRAVNDKLAADDRVSISMLPLGDGLTLALKR